MFESFRRWQRTNKAKTALDSLIEREWVPSQLQFQFDLQQRSAELESEGFSPEFRERFGEFCGILRTLYSYAIYGMSPERFLREGEKGEFSMVYLSQMIDGAPFGRTPLPTLSGDNLPDDERYKLRNRRYAITRAAKTLIHLSPVGEAIDNYRRENPLPNEFPDGDCRREGAFMHYCPTIYYWINDLRSDIDRDAKPQKPWLNGSDAREGDFFYAAHDLLKNEEWLLNTFPPRKFLDLETNFIQRVNLIQPGTKIPETYASRFMTAKRKLEKYGPESMGKYFVRGEVGEDGKDGQLVLFGCNAPKGTRYLS
ncbi:MAG TPA: hypothetical protein VJG31_00190 [Candidatus Nanoarchaeia archaeon]|nr:hypothetical protein [Candidatus Nanoarchaeia archaeon]